MCFKCSKDMFVPKKRARRSRKQRERLASSFNELPDNAHILVCLFVGIPTSQCVFLNPLYRSRFVKENNDYFWESLFSHTSFHYKMSALHRVCFPDGYNLCDDDICQLMPSVETPTNWREYFGVAVLKLEWLCGIQRNCASLQNVYMNPTEQALQNGIFSRNEVFLVRRYGEERDCYQSLYAYDNLETLRLRSQSRIVYTTSSGCIIEELSYLPDRHQSDSALDREASLPEVSLCVLSALTGSVGWRDIIEGVVGRQVLGLGAGDTIIRVDSVVRREMPFEVYYLEQSPAC